MIFACFSLIFYQKGAHNQCKSGARLVCEGCLMHYRELKYSDQWRVFKLTLIGRSSDLNLNNVLFLK